MSLAGEAPNGYLTGSEVSAICLHNGDTISRHCLCDAISRRLDDCVWSPGDACGEDCPIIENVQEARTQVLSVMPHALPITVMY